MLAQDSQVNIKIIGKKLGESSHSFIAPHISALLFQPVLLFNL